jgi:hypothetical protein
LGAACEGLAEGDEEGAADGLQKGDGRPVDRVVHDLQGLLAALVADFCEAAHIHAHRQKTQYIDSRPIDRQLQPLQPAAHRQVRLNVHHPLPHLHKVHLHLFQALLFNSLFLVGLRKQPVKQHGQLRRSHPKLFLISQCVLQNWLEAAVAFQVVYEGVEVAALELALQRHDSEEVVGVFEEVPPE